MRAGGLLILETPLWLGDLKQVVVSWTSAYHLVVKLALPWVSRDFRGTPQERKSDEYLGATTKSLMSFWGKRFWDYFVPDFR